MAYQDCWVRGENTKPGDRACADRYALLKPVVEAYHRQVTVWDIGANLGYFGHRLAEEFGAVSVMIDQSPGLAAVCRANDLPTTIAMQHALSAEDLAELAASEHADIVLALNVLHHMKDWRQALPAILSLGETIIIETPGPGDVNSAHYAESQLLIEALMELQPALVLGWSPSHVTPGVDRPMFLFRNVKPTLSASYAYIGRVRERGPHPVRQHCIESTATDKWIHYSSGESRAWAPGMNLWNWLQMGGCYPDRAIVQRAAVAAAQGLDTQHGDFRPWNLILQGQGLQVIDHGHRHNNDADGLRETLAWIADPGLAHAH
jgi:hypothetical protein